MAAPVSARFKELVTSGYQMVSRVEVMSPAGAVLLDSDNPATPLSVAGGSIHCDRTAAFRRSVSDLVIVDDTGALVPTAAADHFSAVSGNELRLSVGMMVDGVKEYVVQGIFGLAGAKTEDTAGGLTITLTAYDRGRRFSRGKATARAFDASNATLIRDAIATVLTDIAPGLVVLNDSPTYLTPSQVLKVGDDPWEFCRALAESMGYELFFDRVGNCILQKVPDPNNTALLPSWTYAEGTSAIILGIGRDQSNEQTFNGVVVTGMNPSNGSPVRIVVWDDNPASPTYWRGPYGQVPDSYQSDKIGTVDQATAAGVGRLNELKGLTEQVTFSIVPNPALEPSDLVQLVRAKSKFPLSGPGSGSLLVDSFDLNLLGSAGEMSVTCRQRRLS